MNIKKIKEYFATYNSSQSYTAHILSLLTIFLIANIIKSLSPTTPYIFELSFSILIFLTFPLVIFYRKHENEYDDYLYKRTGHKPSGFNLIERIFYHIFKPISVIHYILCKLTDLLRIK